MEEKRRKETRREEKIRKEKKREEKRREEKRREEKRREMKRRGEKMEGLEYMKRKLNSAKYLKMLKANFSVRENYKQTNKICIYRYTTYNKTWEIGLNKPLVLFLYIFKIIETLIFVMKVGQNF